MKNILQIRNAKGVTLIELLVGVALLGITGMMVASLAISLNKSALQNEVDTVIAEMTSDILYKISVKGVCDYNFAGESATQASVGNITNVNGTTIYSVGMSTGSGFTISAMSLAQINSTRADLTVKFSRTSTSSTKTTEVSRNIRLTTIPNSVDPTIIDSCSFSITSATEDLIHYACNGEGAIFDDNETPADTTDDKCVWAGYSVEQCPATERVSRFELVNIPDGAGKMLPIYRPVCVTVDLPKSLTCASGKFLVGYNASSNQIICRTIKPNDISQYFHGLLSDCSTGTTYPIEKVLDDTLYNINIACTPIPTGTPTNTPTAGVYELRFGTPAITGTDSYSFQLFRDGVAVSVATATAYPLRAFVVEGPCTGLDTSSLVANCGGPNPPAANDSSRVWATNPKICTPVAFPLQFTLYGIIGRVYSDQNMTNVLASTACLPISTSSTATPTPTATATNTPVPSNTPTPGPGTNTATPTPTSTPIPGPCTLGTWQFHSEADFIDYSTGGSFSISAESPIAPQRHVNRGGYRFKTGDFDVTFTLDSIPSFSGPISTMSNMESETNGPQHRLYRSMSFVPYISAYIPASSLTYSVLGLSSKAQRYDQFFTKDDPACTTSCSYSGATVHINEPWFTGCWIAGSGGTAYYRVKRTGNTLQTGCGSSSPPTLAHTLNLNGCSMDAGLYLGVFLLITDDLAGGTPNIYPMPAGDISPGTLDIGTGF